jgi:hypothetical protein
LLRALCVFAVQIQIFNRQDTKDAKIEVDLLGGLGVLAVKMNLKFKSPRRKESQRRNPFASASLHPCAPALKSFAILSLL